MRLQANGRRQALDAGYFSFSLSMGLREKSQSTKLPWLRELIEEGMQLIISEKDQKWSGLKDTFKFN